MLAGTLTEIIKILRPTVTRSELGEQVTEYQEVTEERASVKYASNAGRSLVNNAVMYNEQFEFIVYYYADVRNYDIIEYQDRKYNIIFIQEERMTNIKKIMCELIHD